MDFFIPGKKFHRGMAKKFSHGHGNPRKFTTKDVNKMKIFTTSDTQVYILKPKKKGNIIM